MIKEHTIELLKECNAGIKTAVNSIDEVMDSITSEELRKILRDSKQKHEELGDETHQMLNQYHREEKDPSPMARMMSWMKINMKLLQDSSDSVVADLMTDGANMGVKSLTQYLNEYSEAAEEVKQLTKRLIKLEEKLCEDMRQYL